MKWIIKAENTDFLRIHHSYQYLKSDSYIILANLHKLSGSLFSYNNLTLSFKLTAFFLKTFCQPDLSIQKYTLIIRHFFQRKISSEQHIIQSPKFFPKFPLLSAVVVSIPHRYLPISSVPHGSQSV